MRRIRCPRALRIGLALSALVLTSIAGPIGVGTALAAAPAAPAWEPDTIGNPAPYSNLTFYDAQGQLVTGGSNLSDLFAYAVGNSAFNVNGSRHATTASLAFATPNHTGNTSTWNLSAFSTGTSFPLTAGPANLMVDTTTPIYTSDGTGGQGSNLTAYLGSSVDDTTSGYSNLIQVRMADSGLGSGTSSLPSYWEADIAYNTGASAASVVVNATEGYSVSVPAGSWVQVFPLVTATTTTLSSTLTSSTQPFGADIPLKATIAPAAAGTVQFFDGSTALGSPVTVSAGTASTIDSTPPTVGAHHYSAVFSPTVGSETGANSSTATIVGGSTSSTLSFTIAAASQTTTTVVASGTNPSVSGQPVTFTATVSPTPTGVSSVEFERGGVAITGCTAAVVSTTNGTATCTTTSGLLTASGSPYSITAVYGGNSSFAGSTSTALTQTVDKAASTTALATSANPAGTGQTVTLTATVSASAPGSGTPSGTVGFEDNGTPITTPNDCSAVAVSAGAATCQTTFTGGSHPLIAAYSGDADFGVSSSSTLTQMVNPATTTAVTSSAPGGSVVGQAVTYTATVSVVPPGTGTPGGTVVFKDGTATICTTAGVTLSGAVATCTAPAYTSTGVHSITAVYSGSASFGGSTSPPLTQTVGKASTTTALTSSAPTGSVTGQPVTYTATISVTEPGAGTPTGTVTFKDGATTICAPTLLPTGKATCSAAPTAGTSPHSITAVYASDTNFVTSTSTALTQTVTPAATTTALKSSANPSLTGQAVTYTATVTVTSPGTGIPAGTVAFSDGLNPITACTAQAVSAGKATCIQSYSDVGSRSITTVYSAAGDPANFLGSTSPALTQDVQAAVAPGPPTDLAATSGTGQVGLTWKAPTSDGGSALTGYDIYVGTGPGLESTLPVNVTPVTGLAYTVTGLTNGKHYYVLVKALNIVGPSVVSNEASAVPLLAPGYWLVAKDGGVFTFGNAGFHGSLGGVHLNAPIVGMAAAHDNGGYWLVAKDGGVFTFGDAGFHGSLGGIHLNAPIVGMAATPGGGYVLVGSDGGVFTFGGAGFHGSLGGLHLNAPIVGIVATADGGGYWLVASDGGVFTFGDAGFHGSLGGVHLSAPIVGMAAAPGGGYVLVGSDGGVFTFGGAGFHGSLGGQHLSAPITAIIETPDGGGYWLIGTDGGVFTFGDAAYHGSVPGDGISVDDIVAGA